MSTSGSANYVLLTRLADEFAARYRAGERPSLQEYIDRHPELADDIRELFPAMVEIEQVKNRKRCQEPKTILFHQCAQNRFLTPYLLRRPRLWPIRGTRSGSPSTATQCSSLTSPSGSSSSRAFPPSTSTNPATPTSRWPMGRLPGSCAPSRCCKETIPPSHRRSAWPWSPPAACPLMSESSALSTPGTFVSTRPSSWAACPRPPSSRPSTPTSTSTTRRSTATPPPKWFRPLGFHSC